MEEEAKACDLLLTVCLLFRHGFLQVKEAPGRGDSPADSWKP